MNTAPVTALEFDRLEAVSDAARAELDAAVAHLAAVNLAIKALVAVDDLATFDSALSAEDKADLAALATHTSIGRLRGRIPGIKADIGRLEDVASDAQMAFNAAWDATADSEAA